MFLGQTLFLIFHSGARPLPGGGSFPLGLQTPVLEAIYRCGGGFSDRRWARYEAATWGGSVKVADSDGNGFTISRYFAPGAIQAVPPGYLVVYRGYDGILINLEIVIFTRRNECSPLLSSPWRKCRSKFDGNDSVRFVINDNMDISKFIIRAAALQHREDDDYRKKHRLGKGGSHSGSSSRFLIR